MNPYRPFAVRLSARERLSPSFVRITLAGDDLATCGAILLDQRVKLLFGVREVLDALVVAPDWYPAWLALPDVDRPVLRTYTLSAVRADADGSAEVDIDVAIHAVGEGEGAAEGSPGLRFALHAPLGTPTVLVAGDATVAGHDTVGVAWRPGDAREVLIVGDETALPAVVNIAATLPADAVGQIILEVPESGDERSFAHPGGVRVTWLARDRGEQAGGVFGQAAGESGEPEELLWDEVAGDGVRYGWIAGETGWVNRLRAEARAAGVPKGQVAFMGYWKRGAAGT